MSQETVIARPRYIEKIRPYIGKKLIKAIIGQRRTGKSYFLLQVAQLLREEYPDWLVLHIDLERIEWRHLRTADDLIEEVKIRTKTSSAPKVALLLDEIQEIEGFEIAVRGFAADDTFDVYISGSNAEMLSGEIATLFAGRAVNIGIHTLSYDEFLIFHGLDDSDASLDTYLRYGGLPFLARLAPEDHVMREYLQGILDSVVLKDIVQRHKIRNPGLLERMLEFIADNVGSPTSARNIARYLKNLHIDASAQSVLDYLGFLCRSFAIVRCPIKDVSGKKILEGISKYYFEDLGLREVIRGNTTNDINRIVENAVFTRLAIDGWSVSTGRVGDREIDFCCERGSERCFVQAAYLVPDPAAHQREFGVLYSLEGGWPRYVISMDPVVRDWQGIHHLRLRDFLRDGL